MPSECRFSVCRDNDDEGTFVIARSRTEKDATGRALQVAHLHVPDENVRKDHWFAGDVHVRENLRRGGIASRMYEIMEQHLQLPPRASPTQSEDGRLFWEGLELKKGPMSTTRRPRMR